MHIHRHIGAYAQTHLLYTLSHTHSSIIKDAIYTSALEVTFIGASVSDGVMSCTMQTMRNKHNVPIHEYQICLFSIVQGFMKLLPNGDRAAELQFFQYRPNSESEGKWFLLLLPQQAMFTNQSYESTHICRSQATSDRKTGWAWQHCHQFPIHSIVHRQAEH